MSTTPATKLPPPTREAMRQDIEATLRSMDVALDCRDRRRFLMLHAVLTATKEEYAERWGPYRRLDQ